MASLTTLIARLDLWLTRALDAAVIGLAGLLFVLLNIAVVSRFVFNNSVSWSEELPAHILAALTFIGAAYLTRTSEHLGFDAVVRILPPGVKRAVMAGNLILIAGFGVLLAWYGGIAAASFGSRMMISVDLPMALFRYTMPVGGALIALISVTRLAGLLTGQVHPDDLLPESDA
ncbi:TRAP transporter small permease [Roseicyclus mahoneyensis]|uniref:TRAP transporter small permease protein n=1 Tax=Roseicyclus mahoneyensis TaxID=164332 RepID=A0A316GDW5_9RHOB|nr:TRAP transporter small permease [Roseicyclus mahoneyensis]PWK59171.1 TRAP-type C4-dicarboxylate transport system permease small subunit [Roseicyclus mahoneyensis]